MSFEFPGFRCLYLFLDFGSLQLVFYGIYFICLLWFLLHLKYLLCSYSSISWCSLILKGCLNFFSYSFFSIFLIVWITSNVMSLSLEILLYDLICWCFLQFLFLKFFTSRITVWCFKRCLSHCWNAHMYHALVFSSPTVVCILLHIIELHSDPYSEFHTWLL